MTDRHKHIQNLRHIFLQSVESVRPVNLLSAANNFILQPQPGNSNATLNLQIQDQTLNIAGKRCHVVGFGKAVLGMAVQLERALQNHLTGGILSIPTGTLRQFKHVKDMQLAHDTRISVLEGALNNQPDERALDAATRIKQLASSMREHDILFVLISGGGSALLPLPRPPLTLPQKMQLIRQLANRGASIDEMNLVRIALSDIKGGRLAAAARRAHAIISFVISDIVGDPIDLIASGPTCAALLQRSTAKEVLQRHDMWADLQQAVQQLIEAPTNAVESKPGSNNYIYIVGDNRIATARAAQEASLCGYHAFIITHTLQGEVQQLVMMYTKLLEIISNFRTNKSMNEEQLRESFQFDVDKIERLRDTLLMSERSGKPLLLILAGEPTVKVTGDGLGGRNQELALRMALALYDRKEFEHISFLSAGTDGIDGPTPAAGAIGSSMVLQQYLTHHVNHSVNDVRACLANNDSYNFYKHLDAGRFHIITGHTGTNVMDLHLLLMT